MQYTIRHHLLRYSNSTLKFIRKIVSESDNDNSNGRNRKV